jgi:hypothetical protein
MMKFPIYGNIKHVPNHQPAIISSDSEICQIWLMNFQGVWRCFKQTLEWPKRWRVQFMAE